MKRLKTVILIISLAALFSGCTAEAEDVPATSEAGILKVGIVNGNDRFTSDSAGSPTGAEGDVARLAAGEGGYAVQFEFCDNTGDLLKGIQEGRFDLGFGRIAETDKRLDDFTVSAGYGKGSLFLVTPRNNYMDCLTIMQTGTLGVSAQAEPLEDEVEGIGNVVTETYTNGKQLRDDIASGKIIAGLVSEREAVLLAGDSVQAQELISSPKETYVAVMPKGSPLLETVNAAVSKYRISKDNNSTGE
ncbi:MAG: transporter substrate-binding domain-containing protein [Lachnospiraceae bacterium]|nr:transporter substrate-binding domain-containing protein [Lachnospiraceae bacterium]